MDRSQSESHFEFLILGGGTAGITVASRIIDKLRSTRIAIIEPSQYHYYQPLWTLVGGGVVNKKSTMRKEARVIPKGAKWIRDFADTIDPQANAVSTRNGGTFTYDYLVVAPGIQIDWDKVRGLPESIGKNGVCSNFSYQYTESTWEAIRSCKQGNAIFTFPNTETKCGGAPQKIMWLADHHFRKTGVRSNIDVRFVSPKPRIFGVEPYTTALEKLIQERNILTHFRNHLTEIRPDTKEAVLENLDDGSETILPYEMIHVTPPQSAPDFIKKSPLADEEGWVDVDPHTLQHKTYPNVFGLGDACNAPTAKTGAAVRKQAPVVVENLLACRAKSSLTARYDGYSSCPLITGYGRLILAEFDYDGNPKETFPFDQSKERWSMYLLKRYALPILYWYGMLKGRA